MKRRPDPRPIYTGAAGALARIFDGALGIVAPRTVHAMQKARMRSAALLAYEGARVDRMHSRIRGQSGDAEILADGEHLRHASRAMARDDAYAASAIQVLEDNVIGTGLLPQSRPDPKRCGMSQEECKAWAQACEDVWRDWSEEADATENGSFVDLQGLALRTFCIDGESVSHMVVDDDGRMWCELIDVDRLESPGMVDTDRIRGGVELGERGQAVAYHILPRHPDDILGRGRGQKPERVLRQDGSYSVVQHIYRRRRPGETRGIPRMSAALAYTRGLHDYLDSELAAARANSKISMFIKRSPSTSDPDIFPVQAGEGTAGMDRGYIQRLESGTAEYLEEGESIEPFIPNRPGTTFEPFVVRSLRGIAAAQGLAYELVGKDLGSLNYSSARALLLEVRRGFDGLRAFFVRRFCMPWWNNVMLAAVADGRLRPPARFLDDPRPFLAVRWIPPGYGWVDPTKEVQAAQLAVEANLSTPYDEAMRSGRDAEEILEDRARFFARAMEIEEQYGLAPGTLSGRKPAPPPVAAAPAEAPEEGGGDDGEAGGEENNQTQEEPVGAGAEK